MSQITKTHSVRTRKWDSVDITVSTSVEDEHKEGCQVIVCVSMYNSFLGYPISDTIPLHAIERANTAVFCVALIASVLRVCKQLNRLSQYNVVLVSCCFVVFVSRHRPFVYTHILCRLLFGQWMFRHLLRVFVSVSLMLQHAFRHHADSSWQLLTHILLTFLACIPTHFCPETLYPHIKDII